MQEVVRRIGLSLGADVCWPTCYERILDDLDLKLDLDGQRVRFLVERVTIEPFSLRQKTRYDLVVDRVTHWYHTSREWIKKAVIMDDVYVFNNPWAIQSMEKQTTYCAMIHLGFPVPDTWMIPPKAYEELPDLDATLRRYARMFDLGDVGKQIGYPLYMKPYDGGAWRGVSRIEDEGSLRAAYEQSGKLLMHLQRSVEGFDTFVRCIGLGPQFLLVSYDPSAPLHDRYQIRQDFVTAEDQSLLEDMTMTINSFFGWDFNSCEAVRADGQWYPFDFANACPDSQVTSLHYHFPWLVMANLRWSIYVCATKKPMRKTLDWQPYYDILNQGLPYRERLSAYAAIGHQRMETERFRDFCSTHLKRLDEVAWEFFGTEVARQAVRAKVESLYPAHEVDLFTDLFWGRIQQWRSDVAASAGVHLA